MSRPIVGRFPQGLAYTRLGEGERIVVVFHGLFPDNEPMTGFAARALLAPFAAVVREATVYVIYRRSGLPAGCTLEDMADEYAGVVEAELGGGPVDVVGISTGGSIAQLFALRHPELVRRLVLYSAACTLGDDGRTFQRRSADLARAGRWADLVAEMLDYLILPRRGPTRTLTQPLYWLVRLAARPFVHAPSQPGDFVVTAEAEDAFDVRDRLGEIRAPTLVIGGGRDPFYPAKLFRETAAGIPGARLLLLRNAGHGPGGRRVQRAMAAFLAG